MNFACKTRNSVYFWIILYLEVYYSAILRTWQCVNSGFADVRFGLQAGLSIVQLPFCLVLSLRVHDGYICAPLPAWPCTLTSCRCVLHVPLTCLTFNLGSSVPSWEEQQRHVNLWIYNFFFLISKSSLSI